MIKAELGQALGKDQSFHGRRPSTKCAKSDPQNPDIPPTTRICHQVSISVARSTPSANRLQNPPVVKAVKMAGRVMGYQAIVTAVPEAETMSMLLITS